MVRLKHKSKEWLVRYFPAEIVGTITAIGAASLAHLLSTNYVLIAYIGSLGEAIGFYSTTIIQNVIRVYTKNNRARLSYRDYIKISKDILLEFGPAGLIDGLLLRPLFMYLFPIFLKNFTLGILVGKIAGDITFYILVIASYEIRKKYRKIASS